MFVVCVCFYLVCLIRFGLVGLICLNLFHGWLGVFMRWLVCLLGGCSVLICFDLAIGSLFYVDYLCVCIIGFV